MRVTCVVGGQAGSEGKGAVCAYLHRNRFYKSAVRVGGPNAGHTAIDAEGRRWALRQLPIAAVIDPTVKLYIAAGSEVDLEVLGQEVRSTSACGYDVRSRLVVDQEATVIDNDSVLLERSITTGTTGKGIGGSRAQRALRAATLARDAHERFDRLGIAIGDTQERLRDRDAGPILLEGTQGYILGSHAGEYPYATSGDCRAIDFMAACGMPPMEAEIFVVLRMNPIRIAGNSGYLSNETTWENLGIEPEMTTVTQKVRRVGLWNEDWADRAIRANAGPNGVKVVLTFADYTWPELKKQHGHTALGDLPREVVDFVSALEEQSGGMAVVSHLGTGPDTMIDLY